MSAGILDEKAKKIIREYEAAKDNDIAIGDFENEWELAHFMDGHNYGLSKTKEQIELLKSELQKERTCIYHLEIKISPLKNDISLIAQNTAKKAMELIKDRQKQRIDI